MYDESFLFFVSCQKKKKMNFIDPTVRKQLQLQKMRSNILTLKYKIKTFVINFFFLK